MIHILLVITMSFMRRAKLQYDRYYFASPSLGVLPLYLLRRTVIELKDLCG
jgi:hypothetical protein